MTDQRSSNSTNGKSDGLVDDGWLWRSSPAALVMTNMCGFSQCWLWRGTHASTPPHGRAVHGDRTSPCFTTQRATCMPGRTTEFDRAPSLQHLQYMVHSTSCVVYADRGHSVASANGPAHLRCAFATAPFTFYNPHSQHNASTHRSLQCAFAGVTLDWPAQCGLHANKGCASVAAGVSLGLLLSHSGMSSAGGAIASHYGRGAS